LNKYGQFVELLDTSEFRCWYDVFGCGEPLLVALERYVNERIDLKKWM